MSLWLLLLWSDFEDDIPGCIDLEWQCLLCADHLGLFNTLSGVDLGLFNTLSGVDLGLFNTLSGVVPCPQSRGGLSGCLVVCLVGWVFDCLFSCLFV